MSEEYLKAAEAAVYLGVHRSRIYALAESGRLGRRIAGYWVFTKAELDQFAREVNKKGGRPRKNQEKL